MLVCLDSNIVMYLNEPDAVWTPKAEARIAAIRAALDEVAVCETAILECLIGPFKSGDAATEAEYRGFLADPLVRLLHVSRSTWERAARIAAGNNFKPIDSLHLATAVEHGCGLFLTADARLGRCTDITVEVLK
ncbi:MAG: PIN domain-containing protein [Gemmataceae bacterium]|nr:PIN domain-containing protein [Gemmataceae bacterium]